MWDESIWYLIFTFGWGIPVRYSDGRTGVKSVNGHSTMHCEQLWKKKKKRSQRYSQSHTEKRSRLWDQNTWQDLTKRITAIFQAHGPIRASATRLTDVQMHLSLRTS